MTRQYVPTWWCLVHEREGDESGRCPSHRKPPRTSGPDYHLTTGRDAVTASAVRCEVQRLLMPIDDSDDR